MLKRLTFILSVLCLSSIAFGDVSVKLNILKWVQSRSIRMADLGSGKSTINKKKADDITFYISTADGYKPLNISTNKITSISYNGVETFILYSKVSDENGDTFKEACKVALPSGVEEMFLLMLQSGSSVRMFPMNVSPKVLPKGKLAIINITGQPLAIQFDGKQAGLPRNSHCILETKASASYKDLKIAARKKGQWRLIYNSGVSIPKKFRNIVLLYSTGKDKSNVSVDVINLEG